MTGSRGLGCGKPWAGLLGSRELGCGQKARRLLTNGSGLAIIRLEQKIKNADGKSTGLTAIQREAHGRWKRLMDTALEDHPGVSLNRER